MESGGGKERQRRRLWPSPQRGEMGKRGKQLKRRKRLESEGLAPTGPRGTNAAFLAANRWDAGAEESASGDDEGSSDPGATEQVAGAEHAEDEEQLPEDALATTTATLQWLAEHRDVFWSKQCKPLRTVLQVHTSPGTAGRAHRGGTTAHVHPALRMQGWHCFASKVSPSPFSFFSLRRSWVIDCLCCLWFGPNPVACRYSSTIRNAGKRHPWAIAAAATGRPRV